MVYETGAPRIMGILNITPDSFSDGGKFIDTDAAFAHGMRMMEEGAVIIDVGGESTRPGAQRISAQLQMDRVLPVIERLSAELPETITISIDTTLAKVADEAVKAGAALINDVSAGRDDAGIFKVAVENSVPIVLMHMQGEPGTMQDNPQYTNLMDEVCGFLEDRVKAAVNAGINPADIIIDPGIGFGKTYEHNRKIIQGLSRLVKLRSPVLLGASRKRFIRTLSDTCNIPDLTVADTTVTILGALAGVSIFRVHDVAQHRRVLDAIREIKK